MNHCIDSRGSLPNAHTVSNPASLLYHLLFIVLSCAYFAECCTVVMLVQTVLLVGIPSCHCTAS